MADNSLTDGGFWLPSEFLTDEDILVGKENFDKNGLISNNNPCFSTEFPPYGFGSFDSSSLFHNSPVESVTESESDEDDFLTGLARQFARSTLLESHKVPYGPRHQEKTWILSGSPQSTLSPVFSNGSPNGPSQGPSPPTSPSGEKGDAWDLICEAAGQVNMLKMKNEALIKSRGLFSPTHKFTPLYPPNPNTGLCNTNRFQQVKQVGGPIWGQQQVYQNRGSRICVENGGGPVGSGRCGRALGLPESAWPTLQVQKQQFYQNQQQNGGGGGVRLVLPRGRSGGGCGGVKRGCAGTGVFLPRRYEAPFDSRKKSGCSTAVLPARVVQALNKSFDTMITQAQTQAQAQAQPPFSGSFFLEYDMLMARRNALMAQQRRNSMGAEGAMNYEIRLPQEWTY